MADLAGATASNNFIRRDGRAEAIKEIAGSIARAPFIAGEPIREQKLVKANGSGFMAAILPTGMRAISTEISPETGAGGFILPNDRVDVHPHQTREESPTKPARRRQFRDHPPQYPRARDRPGAEGKGRPERPRRQDRHAGVEARAGRDAGARAPGRHAVAGAAQHRRRQHGRRPVRRSGPKTKRERQRGSLRRRQIKRRHRSDRKDVRYEVWGKSVRRCELSAVRALSLSAVAALTLIRAAVAGRRGRCR